MIFCCAVLRGMESSWRVCLRFELLPCGSWRRWPTCRAPGGISFRRSPNALKQEGLLAGDARFENVDQLLEGLEQTASQVADLCNAPPLDVAGLRREWSAFREAVAKIPPRNLPSVGFLGQHWEQLKAEAAEQNRPVFELSSMMAISAIARVPVTLLKLARASNRAVWRSGQTLGASVLLHYSQILGDIHERGYAAYWAQEFQPYLRAAAGQFSPKHRSLTARWLKKAIR